MTARILIVDDDEALVTATKRGLKMTGYHVTGTLNPVEALQFFKDGQRFDAVISDMEMPGMHGDVLCVEIQKIAKTPFILCSGNHAVKVRGAKCGADRVFEKPCSPTDLRSALAELIGCEAES
jgi:CheY-like chemotaxis protein